MSDEAQTGALLGGVLTIQCFRCGEPFDYAFAIEDPSDADAVESDSAECPRCPGHTIEVATLCGAQVDAFLGDGEDLDGTDSDDEATADNEQ